MNVRDVQVGGNHYKGMAIQVTEFAERNGWSPCPSNILKYLCRHQDKNGRQDLEKCLHYVDLRHEFTPNPIRCYSLAVRMFEFIRANGYGGKRAECLLRLEGWACNGYFGQELKQAIAEYMEEEYPQ